MAKLQNGLSKLIMPLTVFTILLSPFTDTQLQNTPLKILGASPAFFPLICIWGIMLLMLISGQIRFSFTFLFVLLFVAGISVFGLLVFSQKGLYYLDENLIYKGGKQAILIILFLLPILASKYLPYENCWVKRSIIIAYLLTITGILIDDVLGHGMFLHNTANAQMRPRGFTRESSHLSLVLVSLGPLAIYVVRGNLKRILFGAILLVSLAYTRSKGGLIIALSAASIVGLWKSRYLVKNLLEKKIVQIIIALALIIVWFIAAPEITKYFILDLARSTSVATRGTLATTTGLILLKYPLGVGFSGYLPALVNNIPIAIKYLTEILPFPLNFWEVQSYVSSSTDKFISSKTFLFDGMILFGIPFIIFFIRFFQVTIWGLYKKNQWILLFSSIAVLMGLAMYSSGGELYSISLLLGFAFRKATSDSDALII